MCGHVPGWSNSFLKSSLGGLPLRDYDRADARISGETKVPYVLVRPSALQEKPGNGKYRVFQGDGTFARPMAKEDVAQFLLDAVSSDQWGRSGRLSIGRQEIDHSHRPLPLGGRCEAVIRL